MGADAWSNPRSTARLGVPFEPWHTAPMLVSPHRSIAGAGGGRNVKTPDPALLDDVVALKRSNPVGRT
jgi:hypothetical protein